MTAPASTLLHAFRAAKQSGDFSAVSAAIPYATFTNTTFRVEGTQLIAEMAYSAHLIGNFSLPALHGGAVGALLESAAIMQVMLETDSVQLPKTITITVDYLRPGKPRDTYARAVVMRHGKRVVNVRAEAWQEDPNRPIAMAKALFLVKADEEPIAIPK